MLAPICVACRLEMRCAKNGVAVVGGHGLTHGDRYQCRQCGAEILTGFGREVIREGWEPDFDAVVAAEAVYGPVFRVQEPADV